MKNFWHVNLKCNEKQSHKNTVLWFLLLKNNSKDDSFIIILIIELWRVFPSVPYSNYTPHPPIMLRCFFFLWLTVKWYSSSACPKAANCATDEIMRVIRFLSSTLKVLCYTVFFVHVLSNAENQLTFSPNNDWIMR